MDCTGSMGIYNPIESLKNKESQLFLYLQHPKHIHSLKHKPSWALTTRQGDSLTSVYMVSPNVGYGDMPGTNDALLFEISYISPDADRIPDNATLTTYAVPEAKSRARQLAEAIRDGHV